ncbi:plastid division protein PDV2-like [Cynara cardunculus var. scolymus]|nr:plastid division protein PDV2-like [Cynara cardunculus var. scolymus]
MDEDGIRLVLARASELRSKITNCIHNSSSTEGIKQDTETEDKEDDDDDDESLLNIRDALESLEAQLSSLQALQQQQLYEKEAFLAEIDYSRKRLLQKLKEYKGGDDLEVIQEATAFASSTVEIENNDLLLPPYPRPPSNSLASDSHFPFKHKISQNGVTASHSANELKGRSHQSEPRGSIKGWRQVIGAAAKTVFTLVGFIAVLSLSGFEPRIGKNDWGMSQEHQVNEDKRGMNIVGCPPGKVLVVEDGETRCLVKERVEIPFVSIATSPDVNYGCG